MNNDPDLPQHLSAQGAPASQLRRLAGLRALCETDARCLAAALVGSYAKGCADRISDLDLAVFVKTGHAQQVLAAARGLLDASDVLDQFGGNHGKGGCFRKLVYLDFTSCELHVFDETSAFRLRRPYVAVWDPQDVLRRFVVDGEPVRHEDFAAYEYGDDGLVWELVDCIKWLTRGRTQLAKHHLRKLVARFDQP
jgi:predicted nucleotidyltransferase